MLSRVLCLVYVALRRYVYLFAPSLRRIPWPLLSEALRFPAFIGTMGAYDCSPTLPCHLWSPLAAGTPRRGPVRFPWDTLVSLGTWFSSGWAEPHPARERSVALLGSREVLLKACPGLGTPATPEQPRVSVARIVDGCGEGRFSGAEHCLLPLRGIVWVILAKYSGSVFLRSNPFVRSAPSFRPDLHAR